jgi:hypothetical protein
MEGRTQSVVGVTGEQDIDSFNLLCYLDILWQAEVGKDNDKIYPLIMEFFDMAG